MILFFFTASIVHNYGTSMEQLMIGVGMGELALHLLDRSGGSKCHKKEWVFSLSLLRQEHFCVFPKCNAHSSVLDFPPICYSWVSVFRFFTIIYHKLQ